MSAAVSAVPVVNVSAISLSSFLDIDRKGWARRGRLAGVLGLFTRWAVVEQHDDPVVVALAEDVTRVEHALAGRYAFVLVDCDFHVTDAP
jgi:hypothetical protein